jgi:outer membrane cobalamin receptor
MRTAILRSFLSLTVLIPGAAHAAGDAGVTGTVVDTLAQPIPRARVRATDSTGRELAVTFTDWQGQFTLETPGTGSCFVEASLTGFLPARTDCGNGDPLRIVLAVAPLEQILVVSATRGEAPIGQVASSVTVFTRDEIERRQRPMVADLLRSSVGTTVINNGAQGSLTSLFLRGGESDHTKILLDGVPINDPGGTFDFSNLSSMHVDRIELVRGAQSALFGSDAVSGVLHLFTGRARPTEPRLQAALEGGTYSTVRGGATYGNAGEGFDYSVHASRYVTDNRVPNNEFQRNTISGSAGIELPRSAMLRFIGRAEIGEAGVPGQTAFGRADLDAFSKRRYGVLGATLNQELTPAIRHQARYAFATTRQTSTNLVADPPFTPQFGDSVGAFEFFDFLYDSYDRLGRHHLGYQVDWRAAQLGRAGDHMVTGAIEWDGERATLEDRLNAGETEASRDNFGYTAQYQILWPRVFVGASVRLEDNSSFGFEAIPRASVAVVLREHDGFFRATRVKASAGTGVKEPTIVQSFSTNPFFLGNPDLDPERSRSFEVGLDQSFGTSGGFEVTYFDNRYRNIIATRTVTFTPFTAQYFNIGLTSARGMELQGSIGVVIPVRIRGGYTYLASEILESGTPEDPVFGLGNEAFRRPKHSGFVQADYTWQDVTVAVYGTFVGAAVDSDFASLVPPIRINPGHKGWDLRGSYRVNTWLTAIAALDNLTNSGHMEPLGYPVLGRAFRAGARFEY